MRLSSAAVRSTRRFRINEQLIELSTSEATELFRGNFGLAINIAVRYAARTGASLDLDDLMQEAVLGLIEAAERYEPGHTSGAQFKSYARVIVTGRLGDYHRRVDHLSRDTRRSYDETGDIPSNLLYPLSVDALIAYYGWDTAARQHGPDAYDDVDERLVLEDFVNWIKQRLVDSRQTHIINGMLEGKTNVIIAKELGIHESRVTQLMYPVYKLAAQYRAESFLGAPRTPVPVRAGNPDYKVAKKMTATERIERERLIMIALVAEGCTVSQIGEAMNLAHGTVKSSLQVLFKRYKVVSQPALVNYAWKNGMLPYKEELPPHATGKE